MFDGSKSFWRTREDDKLSGEISILLPDKKKQKKKKTTPHSRWYFFGVCCCATLWRHAKKVKQPVSKTAIINNGYFFR